jgi:S-adenosylmethionine hydrolase
MAIVTLCTDFGTRDEYVGVLKGVILSVNPAATIVDLSHRIPPQDVVAAAYMLRASFIYFPEGSVHTAIVDPGVGTARAIVAARFQGHMFLAPDNGLLPLMFRGAEPTEVVQVDKQDLFRHPVSQTFHGRDIFAPIAAHLAKGTELRAVGHAIAPSRLQRTNHDDPHFDPAVGIKGHVVGIDRFGNLITNIGPSLLDRLASDVKSGAVETQIGEHRILGLVNHYAQGVSGQPVVLIGSRGCLEIAVNCGNAAEALRVSRGDGVCVKKVL